MLFRSFTQDMLKWIDPSEISDNVQPVIGVDPAATADSGKANDRDSDYWGVTVAYVHPRKGKLYVADSKQKRGMTLSRGVEWLRAIEGQIETQAQMIVESNTTQRWLQQALADAGLNAIPVQTTRNKEDKLIDLSIPISNGTVEFCDWSGNQDDFQELRNQMLSFPDSSPDDLMDSLSLIVNHTDITSQNIFGGSYGQRGLWG